MAKLSNFIMSALQSGYNSSTRSKYLLICMYPCLIMQIVLLQEPGLDSFETEEKRAERESGT